jgi:cell division septation protein DedD
MARDYAPRSRNGNNRSPKRNGQGAPAWMWMFVGLTIGLLVAAAIYIRKPIPEDLMLDNPEEQVAQPPTETAPGKAEETAKDEGRFDFYEMLPNYEVVIPKENYAGVTPEEQPALKEPGQYVIQAGSFRTFADADRHKASLALLGIESHIEKITAGDEAQTWYRVRIGPNKDLAVVNEQLRLLHENKVEAILIRLNPEPRSAAPPPA